MHNYTEIKSQEDMETFLDQVYGFHDFVLKEVHLINRYYSTGTGLTGIEQFDAQILIQGDRTFELVCSNVIQLTVTDASAGYIDDRIDTSMTSGTIRLKLGTTTIDAERLFYRIRTDWLGKQARLTSEVPSIEAVAAKVLPLEGNWRQCQNCFDAWQEAPQVDFSLCHYCGQLTELQQ